MRLEDIVSHPAFNGVYSLETWVSLLSWWEGAADMDASKVRRFWHIDWEETLGQTQDVTAGLRRPRGLTWRSWRRCWFVVIHNNLWGDQPMSSLTSPPEQTSLSVAANSSISVRLRRTSFQWSINQSSPLQLQSHMNVSHAERCMSWSFDKDCAKLHMGGIVKIAPCLTLQWKSWKGETTPWRPSAWRSTLRRDGHMFTVRILNQLKWITEKLYTLLVLYVPASFWSVM